MSKDVAHAKDIETAFLAGVTGNLKSAGGRLIPGKEFKIEDRDRAEQVRAAMADRRMYERDLFQSFPHGRSITLRGYESSWIFWKRVRSVTSAGVLAPVQNLLDGGDATKPVSRGQLLEYLDHLTKKETAPQLVGVCAPAGFEADVWDNPPERSGMKLVLVEPRGDGGWRIKGGDPSLERPFVKLFDPEDVTVKLGRVKREIEARSADLLTGSLSASQIAREMELPVPLVSNAFEQVAREIPELHVSRKAGEATLFRGVAADSYEEERPMSFIDKIKNMFAGDGDETNKINLLAEKRAALSSKLDRLFEDIGKLEKKEAALVEEGKASNSKVAKLRLAAQVERLRKDITRFNTTASMLNKQINIISTHIHNLEMAQTGEMGALPDSDELTEAAVGAEEMLERLNASDDLVSSLEVGMAESAISDSQAAILAEFEATDEPAEKEKATGEKRRAPEVGEIEPGEKNSREAQAE